MSCSDQAESNFSTTGLCARTHISYIPAQSALFLFRVFLETFKCFKSFPHTFYTLTILTVFEIFSVRTLQTDGVASEDIASVLVTWFPIV